jgi:hypothetical protein
MVMVKSYSWYKYFSKKCANTAAATGKSVFSALNRRNAKKIIVKVSRKILSCCATTIYDLSKSLCKYSRPSFNRPVAGATPNRQPIPYGIGYNWCPHHNEGEGV